MGDLAQQTRLGTVKNWNEADEDFSTGRKVVLEKVYRNTKQILNYVSAQDYAIKIPESLNEGPEVVEEEVGNELELINFIEKVIQKNSQGVLGVLMNNEKQLENLRKIFKQKENVRFMSFYESQGVEFETVILIEDKNVLDYNQYPDELVYEKRKIERDLKYVALTRSMNRLYVVKFIYRHQTMNQH